MCELTYLVMTDVVFVQSFVFSLYANEILCLSLYNFVSSEWSYATNVFDHIEMPSFKHIFEKDNSKFKVQFSGLVLSFCFYKCLIFTIFIVLGLLLLQARH